MLIRKPGILLATSCNLVSTSYNPVSSTSSTGARESTRHPGCACKGYATTTGDDVGEEDHGQNESKKHVWPRAMRGQQSPTPYQIFAMEQRAEYSKTRFYELVKLYHPDINKVEGKASVPHGVRMERYRLLVAAHAILSDPAKRSAYDRFGAGWNGKAEKGADRSPRGHAPGPFSHSWSSPDDPIWQNATWEDWEKFYARKAREQDPESAQSVPQSPMYLNNTYFMAVVVMLALVGGSVNYGRAQDAGTYFVEQRDLAHDRAAKELRRVRQDMSGFRGRDERIQWFLRQREATMGQMAQTDVEALREEKASRLLSDREVCRSEAISEKDN